MAKRETHTVVDSMDARGDPGDRRQSQRYPAADGAARLGWWSGADFRDGAIMLLDVSLGGAMALADEIPPADLPVWCRLAGDSPSGWVQGRVVRVVTTRRGPHQIHIQFDESCPFDFFKAAVYRR